MGLRVDGWGVGVDHTASLPIFSALRRMIQGDTLVVSWEDLCTKPKPAEPHQDYGEQSNVG